jgi:hypothetical protein
VAHHDAVVHADGVELERHTTRRAYGILHHATEFLQVNVARNDVHVRVADGDERLVPVVGRFDLSRRSQETAMRRTLWSARDEV